MDRTSAPLGDRIPIAELLLAACLLAIAAVLFLRRIFSGALGELPAGEVVFYAALFAMLADLAARRLAARDRFPISRRSGAMLALALSLMFAAGLSATATGALAGLAGIIATFAVSIVFEPRPMARRAVGGNELPGLAAAGANDQSRTGQADQVEVADRKADSGDLCQSFTRRMIEDECYIDGFLAFDLPPGESLRVLHIPFWPPLPADPIVECDIDGLEARVRVPLAAPHGLRVEVRAADACDEIRHGTLHLSAHASASRAAA